MTTWVPMFILAFLAFVFIFILIQVLIQAIRINKRESKKKIICEGCQKEKPEYIQGLCKDCSHKMDEYIEEVKNANKSFKQ